MSNSNDTAVRDKNLAVAANVIALVSETVKNIAGNDIANTVQGQPMTTSYLDQAIAARVQAHLMGEG